MTALIICIRRKCVIGFSLIVLIGLGWILWIMKQPPLPVSGQSTLADAAPVIVIDPGHGGEDGGAVAADGTVESSVNLAISKRLQLLLCFSGQTSCMTRTSEISLHSKNAETIREKKVSDLKNRVKMVNAISQAVLVSIHQNCLPSSPDVQGAQVFYNAMAGADVLAENVQTMLNQSINPEHPKKAYPIASGIYLMRNVKAPAILVECGFLSNKQETHMLNTAAYQLRLAAVLASGILQIETRK